ncbi:DUF6705 family protein [uncultured Chryseobacterium sp.]|uniref:DUF6705 family protein n=1 Tax=uncultured Chryseobacterium sp. TaxID=259322 RepID=UPI00258AE626|nr:DUF6705 family protein [uncultured Chryseobacterium sp.]
MKYLFFILIFFSFSCRSQEQYLPLNTLMESIPPNAYVKDLSNELAPYVGVYKANYQGNEIILYITKEDTRPVHYTDQQFYRDALVIKYIVKNSTGAILQNTQNMNFTPDQKFHTIFSTRTRPTQNTIIFNYDGTNCGVGWGDIYLKKINSTQISWEYRPDDMVFTNGDCPQGTDKTIYLPETKDLIFTKQ